MAVFSYMAVDCGPISVTLRWRAARSQMDPLLLCLGGCYPFSVSAGEAMFHVALNYSLQEDSRLYSPELSFNYFSGPYQSREYPLGSFIHILATVEQKAHQPLLLLLEECGVCTIGCLVDSMTSNSKFEPRQTSSLSLQAFNFAVVEVYIHCKLLAWDPSCLDTSRKACHYVHGWELLDDPSHSNLCSCCDSSCKSQKGSSIRYYMT
uniref:ZP domain-containing protein n=1 Tax=Salmo trutta TaxID=8032 RepID=A0A673XDQ5_SALTR